MKIAYIISLIVIVVISVIDNKIVADKNFTIVKAGKVINAQKNDFRVLEKGYFDQCAVNIILRNKISGRAERELQRDNKYMELVTPKQD